MARLELKDVEIRLGERAILPNLNLTVEEGECLALLGPSGCGKTTTLRTVAGFLRPSQGSVMIGGKSVANVPTNKRNVGIVFQDYALFPHMSVSENVNFGLKARGIGGAEAKSRVAEALAQVRLSEFANRYPEQLSGGQRQRVA
ncbi:MAG: ATP-binding cassette domain-containing protein, partial [Marinibacterium sp.]|nr:ATP-binding cassette domain-containing protein [Marinibacterium sp.]